MINVTLNQINDFVLIYSFVYLIIMFFISSYKKTKIEYECLCSFMEFFLSVIMAVLIILLAGIISPSYWKESPDITYKYVNIVDYDSNNKTFTYTQNEKEHELKYSSLKETAEKTYAEKHVQEYTKDVLFLHITKKHDNNTILYITQKEYKEYNEKVTENAKRKYILIR